MKKIVLMLLAGVLALSAVEWEVEQVENHPDTASAWPVLVLDSQQKPEMVYAQVDYWEDEYSLKHASRPDVTWEKVKVTLLSDFSNLSMLFSIDLDSQGNSYVAYCDYDEFFDCEQLFLASDSSGDFETHRLTGDENLYLEPVVKIGYDGSIHIVYVKTDIATEVAELRHGWLDDGSFLSELIVDSMPPVWMIVGLHDFVIDKTGDLHVFFTGDSFYLYHATASTAFSADWNVEQLTDQISFWPSADVDGNGKLHVAYRGGEYLDSIRYANNVSGTWFEEFVIVTEEPEDIYEWPNLALDPQGTPHIVWNEPNQDWYYDVHYAFRTLSGWSDELITNTPEADEYTGVKHPFRIDNQGYGHLGYAALDDTEEMPHIYYAKSKAPLTISEDQPKIRPNLLEVRGTTVRFTLAETSPVTLNLYDASGRLVSHLTSGNFEAGDHSVPLKTFDLASGVYFVRAEIAERSASAKFVLTR